MRWRTAFVSTVLAVALAGCSHIGEWSTIAAYDDDAQDGWETSVHGPVALVAGDPNFVPVGVQGPQAVADSDGPYLLDTGDRLRVFVYGQPNLSRLYTVDDGGAVSMPLIGRVMARGLTTYKLESRIKARLGSKFVKDPEVTVDISQNRPFFILGEVKTAGQYPYVSGMTVKSAIATAGGYSDRASQRNIEITRRINGLVEKLEVPDDYVIKAGDTLFVHERFL